MARIEWDKAGEHTYETGVDHVVLYPYNKSTSKYDNGVAWNGITGVTESPSGAEATSLYADNIKYLNLISAEDFGATIEGYTYPDEFAECDGSAEVIPGVMIAQQDRKTFGLSYRTQIGNDTDGQNHGYLLHLVYGCLAQPSQRTYNTINESPEANTFSWEVKTTPVNVTGGKPTAVVRIDSTKVDSTKLKALEDKLYGSASAEAELPTPDEVIALLKAAG